VLVLKTIRRAEYAELAGLFFLNGAALGTWFVPLGTILGAHGLDAIKPYAYATTALAAFVSPLAFGAMADRHVAPVKVLRGLALATAVTLAIVATAIHLGWNQWVVLALAMGFALCVAPIWSIASTIVLARLENAEREFGPVRVMAALGWMAGCWLVSALNADLSVRAQYLGSALWLVLAGYTFLLPVLDTPPSAEHLSLRQRLGLDALALLRNPDHRVVFITVALFCIPLAGFYPYAPSHLESLGFKHPSAWMTLAQVSEVVATLLLGGLLLRWRLKWIFVTGLTLGVIRFALSALNVKIGLLAGISLHGGSFALVVILAQIYVDQRVDSAWRARAQALLSLMSGGVGNLAGYLGTGWWFGDCTTKAGPDWWRFWTGLAAAVAAVLLYFLVAYHGLGVGSRRTPPPAEG
jgi:MFS family permease